MNKQKSLAYALSALCAVLFVTFMFVFPMRTFEGASMEPTYPDEATIVYSYFLPKNLTGLIVAVHLNFSSPYAKFLDEHGFVLNSQDVRAVHRVLWDNGTHVETKGDNNTCLDPVSPRSKVEGVIIFESPSYNLFYVYAVCLSCLVLADLMIIFHAFEKPLKSVSDNVGKSLKSFGM